MSGFFRFWFPPILYAAIVFFLSSLSKPPVPFELESNLLHYPEYAFFSFLLLRAFHYGRKENVSIKNVIYAFAISIFFGLFDEFHQAFVPERVPEMKDLIRDAIGSAGGIFAFVFFNFLFNFIRKGKQECKPNS